MKGRAHGESLTRGMAIKRLVVNDSTWIPIRLGSDDHLGLPCHGNIVTNLLKDTKPDIAIEIGLDSVSPVNRHRIYLVAGNRGGRLVHIKLERGA